MKNSNQFCLVIHVVNPLREGFSKGSNTFKTTYRYKGIITKEEVYPIIESHGGLDNVHKAFYNSKLIVSLHEWIPSFTPERKPL